MADAETQERGLGSVMSKCLDLESPGSFFLFAGAGSGKTRALVHAMRMLRDRHGPEFRQSGRQVAVITYTNAASDEIKGRIEHDAIFAVSTIHSFAWELIRGFHRDIRDSLATRLKSDLNGLREKQRKGRRGKASEEREVKITSIEDRLARLPSIKRFVYNPNGENVGKDSLNHAEVIGIAAELLRGKPLMRQIVVRKYPILLIDESQDTQKELVESFFVLQREHSKQFSLALFGDTMQRIYADGKIDLEMTIPEEWQKPAIIVNHRCPRRVVKLINAIRAGADEHVQEPREDASEGWARFFVVEDQEGLDKTVIEAGIAREMAELTGDQAWTGENRDTKTLTLEHHMAAKRRGFSEFFEPLYSVSRFRTGVLQGLLNGIPFFSQQILPLVRSLRSGNGFEVARIVKEYSPLVSPDILKSSESPLNEIRKADAAVRSFYSLWKGGSQPSLIDCLEAVNQSGLFAVPEVFLPILYQRESVTAISGDSTEMEDTNPDVDAWRRALAVPFDQLESYVEYISDTSPFGTHQGIKGLQFPRVMVILDDNEARGFTFSFDKVLGGKEPTATDRKNEAEGKETSADRTRRLLYVTCSRAQKSLAIVMYTNEKDRVKEHLGQLEWFSEDEIVDVDPGKACDRLDGREAW